MAPQARTRGRCGHAGRRCLRGRAGRAGGGSAAAGGTCGQRGAIHQPDDGSRGPEQREDADHPDVAAAGHGRRAGLCQRRQHAGRQALPAFPQPRFLHGPLRAQRPGSLGGAGLATGAGLHGCPGRRAAGLCPGHRHGGQDRRCLPRNGAAVPGHRAGQRRWRTAVRQRPAAHRAGQPGRRRARRHRPGQRRADRPHPAGGPAWGVPGRRGPGWCVLQLLGAAPALRPAIEVRHHQVPRGDLRLHGDPVPVRVRRELGQHGQWPDDRLRGGGGPGPGHVQDAAGLRSAVPPARARRCPLPADQPAAQVVHQAARGHRRGADGPGVGLRHGTGGQPARGRRQPV